jgi:hypothetical protein
VVAVEASASGGSGVALKSSVMASKTEGAAPTLASVAGSSMVICKKRVLQPVRAGVQFCGGDYVNP